MRITMEDSESGAAPHHAFFTESLDSVNDVHALYSRFYADLPGDPRYRSLVRRSFRALAEAEGPVLVYCSAGKDRTGFVAALLLDLLGVDEADIIEDYMASNAGEAKSALGPEIARRFALHGRSVPRREIVDAILGVVPEYIESSFAAIRAESGSVTHWLASIGIGGDLRRQLRERYLV